MLYLPLCDVFLFPIQLNEGILFRRRNLKFISCG